MDCFIPAKGTHHQTQHFSTTCTGKSGKCLTEEKEILSRWTEYCSELYNYESRQGSHLTPNQQSLTPILGLGLQLFRKIYQNYIVGLLLFSESVFGTPILKILVRTLELWRQHCTGPQPAPGRRSATNPP